MEFEPQLTKPPLHHEPIFYNTFSPTSYSRTYHTINNNNFTTDQDQSDNKIGKFSFNNAVKTADYDDIKCYKPREAPVQRDSYRPISPRESKRGDESCRNFGSRNSLSPDNNGLKCNDKNIGLCRLGEESLMFNKYSHSSPNIYSNMQLSASQVSHSGGYYKTRQFSNNVNNNGESPQGRTKQHNNYHQHKHQSDVIVKRAHGLAERFKSRSELMKIDSNPPGLLKGGPWDQLNQTIWNNFSCKAQKENTYVTKISLWKNIFLYIRKCLNSYGLFMVGSTMSGFGLESSDVDMCLLTKPFTSDPRLDALHHLNTVRQLLVKQGLTAESELILAKVPILKFKDKETGFEIDLNCNNSVGIRNTHLLHCYARLDWRVRPLVVMVKLWAQANNINDAKNMTVSSYSWALMVIHYLQCGVLPAVLPCLHGLVPEKFNSDEKHTMDVQEEIVSIKHLKSENTMCLGELLLGFFEYYANFNFNEYAISVRTASKLTIDECRFAKAPKNDPHQWKYLCIEEPFDRTNTARSVFDIDVFKLIQNIIIASYQELDRSSMLSNILPVNLNRIGS